MQKKYITMGLVLDAILLALGVVLATLDRSTLIITMGVKVVDIFLIACWAALGVAAVGWNVFWITKTVKSRPKQLEAPAGPAVQFIPQERLDPEQIRAELRRYRAQRPALEPQMDQGVAQLDSMDRKQAKLKEIFERNQVSSLGDIDATLDDTEQAMCKNMVKVINRAILWDPLEWNKPGKEDIYREHREYIQRLLNRNEDILSMCDRLLSETVGYVDEKNTGHDSSEMHLEVMTETVQSLRKMNNSSDFKL